MSLRSQVVDLVLPRLLGLVPETVKLDWPETNLSQMLVMLVMLGSGNAELWRLWSL